MSKQKIIKAQQKWNKSHSELVKLIYEEQGSKSQTVCTHGTYGNGHGIRQDVCSNCFKILTTEDKESGSYY